MATPALAPMTVDEFLLWEADQPAKHEFSFGRIYAMAGASPRHVLITPNLSGMLYGFLREKPCRFLDADTKLRVEASGASYYPDGMVACPPIFLSERQGVIDNPAVIFEVLSTSSLTRDAGEKLGAYFSIPSLREYVVISSEAAAVTVHQRRGDEWVTRVAIGLQTETRLARLGVVIPHADLYESVTFAPSPETDEESVQSSA